MLKKIITTILILLSLVFIQTTFSSYDSFLQELEQAGLATENIEEQDTISRFELARLLNSIECHDCVNSPQRMVNQYTQNFRTQFKQYQRNDFEDIAYRGGEYNGIQYYYCVAHVGASQYMRGYPANISPICNGQFCGFRSTTYSEFYQVITNLISTYTKTPYQTNRKDIQEWIESLSENSYANRYVTKDEKQLIQELSKKNRNQEIKNKQEFSTYLKYCSFNLEECGFQEFEGITQGYRPIAELNVLYQEDILELKQISTNNLHKVVPGDYVLQILYNIFQVTQCEFDYDYDCDGIINSLDNCPNTFNPSQRDLDKDNIGDVCDNDIDGDGITNPIGIVDDTGNIDISKWEEISDNCIFDINTDQKNSNTNRLGDSCEKGNNIPGVSIKINSISSANAGTSLQLEANIQGEYDSVKRSMGDGQSKDGKVISHIYHNAGLYKITATVKYNNSEAKATASIFVGKNNNEQYALGLNSNKLGLDNPGVINFSANTNGAFNNLIWEFPDETRPTTESKTSYRFKEKGSFQVIVKGIKDNSTKSIASILIQIGKNNIGTKIKTNNRIPKLDEKIYFQTELANFSKSNIKNIKRNLGDQTIINNKSLIASHSYQTAGTKFIQQTITLNNGQHINNYLSIFVMDQSEFGTYYLTNNPNKLKAFTQENIIFTNNYQLSNNTEANSFLMNYRNGKTSLYSESNFSKNIYKYTNPDIYKPKSTIYIDQCKKLESQATIIIDSPNLCLNAKLNGILSQFKCDIDQDNIPDICDNDIDGDGRINLLGLIKHENRDCSYDCSNLNLDLINKYSKFKINNNTETEKENCGLDATPLNSDLLDNDLSPLDFEALIKQCPSTNNNNTINDDQDQDGIEDIYDLCDDLPETYNGVKDTDGCPEPSSTIAKCQEEISPIDSQIQITGPEAHNGSCFEIKIQFPKAIESIDWDEIIISGGSFDPSKAVWSEDKTTLILIVCPDNKDSLIDIYIEDGSVTYEDGTTNNEDSNHIIVSPIGDDIFITRPETHNGSCFEIKIQFPKAVESIDWDGIIISGGSFDPSKAVWSEDKRTLILIVCPDDKDSLIDIYIEDGSVTYEDGTTNNEDSNHIIVNPVSDEDITSKDNDLTISTDNCISCPCHYLDFAGNLNSKDSVKVQFLNINKKILYSESITQQLSNFIY